MVQWWYVLFYLRLVDITTGDGYIYDYYRRRIMKFIFKILSIAMITILLSGASFAQEYYLKGRSALEMNIGFWGGAKVSNTITAGESQSGASTGFQGNILYSYWIREQLAVTLSAGFLAGQANATIGLGTVNAAASDVVPILIGAKYYPFNPAPEDAVRPFVSVAIGTYIGSQASSTIMSQEAISETTFGGQLGVGIDFLLSDHIKLGAAVKYDLMSNFSTPIGARSNYNGTDASLGFGYIF